MKTREEYLQYHSPRWEEFPDVELYADQVLSVIQKHVSFFEDEIEMTFTSNMINNYVKQKIVKPPVNKKYDRVHLAYFTVVCLLKRFFTISEICEGIAYLMKSANVRDLYNVFCDELESAIKCVFDNDNYPLRSSKADTNEIKIIRFAAFTFASMAFTKFTINEARNERKE